MIGLVCEDDDDDDVVDFRDMVGSPVSGATPSGLIDEEDAVGAGRSSMSIFMLFVLDSSSLFGILKGW